MNYNHFRVKSMKARVSWTQEVLGLPVTGKRDRATVKALVKFQKDHGLGGNGVVCEKTFDLLYNCGGSDVSIDK